MDADNNAAISRAAGRLKSAMRLVISLKATINRKPLQVVVLDSLEAELRELEQIIQQEISKSNPTDTAKAWRRLDKVFEKICACAFKMFNALLYQLFSPWRKANIYYEIR